MSTPSAPSLLDRLAASGAIWRGTGGAGLPTLPSGIAALDARLPGGGWPAGALSELLIAAPGIGELRLVLPVLARLTRAGCQVAFVAPLHRPYAPALAQAGLALERTLVVEPATADEAIWASEQLLRSSACGAVLLWTGPLREADQRRLQLAAESGQGLALVYRPPRARGSPSIAALRLGLEADDHGRLVVEILKARGGRPGARFVLEPPIAPPAPLPNPPVVAGRPERAA